MPIPVTMQLEACELRQGDTIQWVDASTAPTAWAGLTVERVDVPRLKAHRGTHIEVVPTDSARKRPLLSGDQTVGIVRQIPTYGEKLDRAADLLLYVIREHIAKARTWTPAAAVEPLTQSNKGVPFVHPAELVNAAAWHIEGMLIHAQYTHWWLFVARLADSRAEADGTAADDHLIDAAQTCVAEALREVQSIPGGGSSEGHRFTDTAKWKGTAKFLEDLTNFGYRSGGLLDTYQQAVANVASCGHDAPAQP